MAGGRAGVVGHGNDPVILGSPELTPDSVTKDGRKLGPSARFHLNRVKRLTLTSWPTPGLTGSMSLNRGFDRQCSLIRIQDSSGAYRDGDSIWAVAKSGRMPKMDTPRGKGYDFAHCRRALRRGVSGIPCLAGLS